MRGGIRKTLAPAVRVHARFPQSRAARDRNGLRQWDARPRQPLERRLRRPPGEQLQNRTDGLKISRRDRRIVRIVFDRSFRARLARIFRDQV